MAIRYVDFVAGDDANAGTSTGAPKKSITSASSGLGPGDEIRVKYTPKSLLGDCSWTNHLRRVGLPSGLIRMLTDGTEVWTASANITTGNVANAQPSPGSTHASITPAGAFTTGKMAFVDLGTAVDLSAFQQLTLKVLLQGTPTVQAAGVFRVDLCSDDSGNTPVNQFTLPSLGNAAWQGMVIDAGVALGSAIRSISIHALSDPGTSTVRCAQIGVTKAPAAADCISHRSVISLDTADEPYWYSVDFFRTESGTDYAYIGMLDTQASDVLGAWWEGATGTYPTYVITAPPYTNGTINVNAVGQLQVFGAAGEAGNLLTVSGGWNADFDAQVAGELSWIDGLNGVGYFFVFTNRNGLHVSRLGVAHAATGFYLLGVRHSEFEDLRIVGGNQDRATVEIHGNANSTNDFCFDVKVRRVFGAQGRSGLSLSRVDYIDIKDCGWTNNPSYYGTAGVRDTCLLSSAIKHTTLSDCVFRNAANILIHYSWAASMMHRVRFIRCTGIAANYAASAVLTTNGGSTDVQFVECDFTGIVIATHLATQELNQTYADFFRCSSDAPLRVAAWPTTGTFWPTWAAQEIMFTAVDGDADVNYSESPLFRMYTSAAGTRLPNGLEWRIQLLSTTAFAPSGVGARQNFVRVPVVESIWCIAGQPVTYTLWVKRNSSSVFCGLHIPDLFGDGEILEEATTVGGWEALTVNFTPTYTGNVTPEFWVWGSALDYASYADDGVQQ